MPPKLLSILQHSLGLDEYGQGREHRNHYVAGGDDTILCRELVALGHMRERPASELSGGDPVFTVTQSGKEAVQAESPKPPKLTRSQQRYQDYLDCDGGFDNFRHFLIYTSAKERRS